MVKAHCLHSSVQTCFETADSNGHSRRLRHLREQLQRENRRAAGPFSHPLAARGPLWRLREQIRDVSRIADAVLGNAEFASESRIDELCSDLRRLLQTQQRWTERLENQIWRLESQTALMKRLQQVLQHGSPGTDQLWEFCELIARETQAIPDGLLLLPEPGQRIVLSVEGGQSLTAMSVETARISVFAAMSLLPEVPGAVIAGGTLLASASTAAADATTGIDDAAISARRAFAEQISRRVPPRTLSPVGHRLIQVAADFAIELERRSLTAAESIVPPPIREFYSVLGDQWPLRFDEEDQRMAHSICAALGLAPASPDSRSGRTTDDGDRLVLTHKLRWHDRESGSSTASSEKTTEGRIRRPHFESAEANRPRFSVFAE